MAWGTHLSGHRSFCTPYLSPIGARAEVRFRLSLRILVPNQQRPCLKTLDGHDYHEPRTLASLPWCQASRSPAVTGSSVETQHTAKGQEAMGRSLLTQRGYPPSSRTVPMWDLEYWGSFLPFSLAAPPQLYVSFSEQGMSPPPRVWDIPGVAPSLYPFPLKAVFPQVTSLLRATSFCAQHPEHTSKEPGHGRDFRTPCAGGWGVTRWPKCLLSESHRTLDCHRSYRRAGGTSQRSQTLIHPSLNNCLPGMGVPKRRRSWCHQGREKAKTSATHTTGNES